MCRVLEEGRKLRVSINRSAAEASRLLSASTSDWIAGTAGTRAAEEALRSLLAAKHVVDAEVALRARSTKQNIH